MGWVKDYYSTWAVRERIDNSRDCLPYLGSAYWSNDPIFTSPLALVVTNIILSDLGCIFVCLAILPRRPHAFLLKSTRLIPFHRSSFVSLGDH